MTTAEMIPLSQKSLIPFYDIVSDVMHPLDGVPYITCINTTDSELSLFHMYGLCGEKAFQAHPLFTPPRSKVFALLAAVMSSEQFRVTQKHGPGISECYARKIVPDTSADRKIVEEMFQTHPDKATEIFFLTKSGELFHYQDDQLQPSPLCKIPPDAWGHIAKHRHKYSLRYKIIYKGHLLRPPRAKALFFARYMPERFLRKVFRGRYADPPLPELPALDLNSFKDEN